MDRLEQATNRAEEASRILGSEMFAKAFADTRQALMNVWSGLDTTDERYAEFAKDLHRKLKCLDSVKKALEEHIATGKLAQREIDGRSRLRKIVG